MKLWIKMMQPLCIFEQTSVLFRQCKINLHRCVVKKSNAHTVNYHVDLVWPWSLNNCYICWMLTNRNIILIFMIVVINGIITVKFDYWIGSRSPACGIDTDLKVTQGQHVWVTIWKAYEVNFALVEKLNYSLQIVV